MRYAPTSKGAPLSMRAMSDQHGSPGATNVASPKQPGLPPCPLGVWGVPPRLTWIVPVAATVRLVPRVRVTPVSVQACVARMEKVATGVAYRPLPVLAACTCPWACSTWVESSNKPPIYEGLDCTNDHVPRLLLFSCFLSSFQSVAWSFGAVNQVDAGGVHVEMLGEVERLDTRTGRLYPGQHTRTCRHRRRQPWS